MKARHYYTTEEEKEEPLHGLDEAIAVINDAKEAKRFLKDLCSPTELQAMADRWWVLGQVKSRKPYRQIYDETGVSVTTIGRVARHITYGTGGYNLIFERLEKVEHATKSKPTIKNRNSKAGAS